MFLMYAYQSVKSLELAVKNRVVDLKDFLEKFQNVWQHTTLKEKLKFSFLGEFSS